MAVFFVRRADTALDSSWVAATPTRPYDSLVRAIAWLAFGLGVLILLGWLFDVTLLKSGWPGQRATQPLTAVCFCLCALSLGLSMTSRGLYRALALVSAILVLVFVALTLWQNALDTDWGFDQLLFRDAILHEQPGQYLRPGRPAGGTLIALAMLGLCLLLIPARSHAAARIYVFLATVGALFAATVLLAYAFGLHSLYAMGLYVQVGVNSGIELAILSAGVLFRRADLGWMSLLTGDSVGAVSTRHLLRWTVPLLVVLAGIVQLGTAADLYGAGFEVTLVTLVGVGLLLAGLLSHAERLNALERVRRDTVTQLRAAQAGLAQADRSKDEFLAILAHELRNPLAPIRNGIEIVRQMAESDPTLCRTADMMTRQMNHLVRLVDDLLDISRITRGTLELRRERVSLREVVERAVESCRALIDTNGHELVVTFDPENFVVDGDSQRLAQVVANVLSNSAKYTDRGGRISVAVEREGGQAAITVTDTGIGIPREALERVFEMFSQVHASRARSDGGLGIGLALVRSLVHMHGGTVTADSRGPGTGSTFTVRLPIAQSAQAHERQIPVQQILEPMRLRILIADDNADAAASLAMLLQLGGHQVQTAADGREAVKLAERFRPDVIFLDVGMPNLDGVEAARQIRVRPWGQHVRIVALTGWGQEVERRRTEAAGIDLHLVKPVDPHALAAILTSRADQHISGQ
jgi:signal transduction histidine kinase/CheY-like chemotaxis protein